MGTMDDMNTKGRRSGYDGALRVRPKIDGRVAMVQITDIICIDSGMQGYGFDHGSWEVEVLDLATCWASDFNSSSTTIRSQMARKHPQLVLAGQPASVAAVAPSHPDHSQPRQLHYLYGGSAAINTTAAEKPGG